MKQKHLFLGISSTNTDIFVPLLYQCVETRNIDVLDCYLSRFRTSVSTSSSSAKYLPPAMNRFMRQMLPSANRKYLLTNILRIESFCSRKTHNKTLFFDSKLLKHGRHFDY
jgi:hypothetical protein